MWKSLKSKLSWIGVNGRGELIPFIKIGKGFLLIGSVFCVESNWSNQRRPRIGQLLSGRRGVAPEGSASRCFRRWRRRHRAHTHTYNGRRRHTIKELRRPFRLISKRKEFKRFFFPLVLERIDGCFRTLEGEPSTSPNGPPTRPT